MNIKLHGLHETVEKSYNETVIVINFDTQHEILTIEALDMMRCRPENTGIDLALRL